MIYFRMLQAGLRIYQKRVEKKLTQAELARRAGISQPNLSNIEKGKRDLTVSTLARIARALETDVRDFFEGQRQPVRQAEKRRSVSRISLTRSRIEMLARAIHRSKERFETVSHGGRLEIGI